MAYIDDSGTNFMSIHGLKSRTINFKITSSENKLKVIVENGGSGLFLIKIKQTAAFTIMKLLSISRSGGYRLTQ
jgi:hypothetical protein